MSKYLYGASMQGIQEFIFKTNRLKDIVGASEMVEIISEDFSLKYEKNCDVIQKAAGNIKILFNKKNDVEDIVKNLPKEVMQYAYGITLSQAVVEVKDDLTKDDLDTLEEKLKSARNKPTLPLDSHINIIKLSPTTGRATYRQDTSKKEFIDYATAKKRDTQPHRLEKKLREDEKKLFAKELSEISNKKNKIAVIHADGNGLGKLLQNLAKKLEKNSQDIKEVFTKFSIAIDNATIKAAKEAYEKMGSPQDFRPIVLGGDDLSVICSADIAIDFTNYFLTLFEKYTEEELKELVDDYNLDEFKNGLTACAGITFSNEKYPFHYSIKLAEELCTYAKTESKKINDTLAPSSLMFYNVQSSFFVSYRDFVKKELEVNDKISFEFGPYYVDTEHGATIQALSTLAKCLSFEGSPKSRLREWLSEMHKDTNYAESLLKRINQVTESKVKIATNNALSKLDKKLNLSELFVEKEGKKISPIHDGVKLASILGEV